jgi:hypothetical protein
MKNASSQYRIGFLNPWKEKAENQAFHSLRIAGQRVGQELVHVTNSDEIIASNLDFVLAVHPLQPKTTDVPTFGVIHSPRALLLDYDFYGQTLPTYDGYLTIMDTIDQFLRALCAGIGKPAHVGFYYNSPQRQSLGCNVEKLAELNALRVCYFGTNWDRRARPLFRVLANRPYMRIYGPVGAWDYLNRSGCYGSVPFDGQSVQRVYASFGAGLVVLSKDHVLDDVISNRIFEIASVGAVAICPDMPWIRKHFGDTVFYYHPFRSAATIASQIDGLVDEIANDPRKASERAREARLIFEKKFSAEVLIENAVRYFEEWRERSGKPTDPADDPLIDVIVRVGGRPISTVTRAIRSIDNQIAGRFRVIFVRYKPIELSEITSAPWTRIKGFQVVDRLGGGRAATLTTGLKVVSSELFAILDDDDFWLSGHIAALLHQIEQSTPGRAYAYSGYLTIEEPAASEPATARERRHIASMVPAYGSIGAGGQAGATFAPHCWLASSALIRFIDLEDWTLSTAEDSLLQASLIGRAEPLFSYRATACTVRGLEGQSDWSNVPTRDEDVVEYFLRVFSVIDRIENKLRAPSDSNWGMVNWALQKALETKSKRLTLQAERLVVGSKAGASIHEWDDLMINQVPLTSERVQLAGETSFVTENGEQVLAILPEKVSWVYGVSIRLDASDLFSGRQWAVLELGALTEVIGAALVNKLGTGFQVDRLIPASQIPVEVWLPIEDPHDLSSVVIRNGAEPCLSGALLRKVWVIKEQQE